MQLSRAVDYALLGLTYLARETDRAASVTEVSREQKLSLYFLRNVFQKLKAAGLLTSRPSQGYTLARQPRLISLRQVVEAVEGPTALQSCLSSKGCAKSGCCRLAKTWAMIQRRFLADLHRTRLTDLI
jgi:Rrf2 family protein